jgi:hypothetical protein
VVIVVDKGKSTLDRLKQKARNSGKSFQLVLQLFSQEEFLRRIYNSPYRDNFKQPEIMTYSLESIVAEKFDAIISCMELNLN